MGAVDESPDERPGMSISSIAATGGRPAHHGGPGRAQGSASGMTDAFGGDADAQDIVARLTAGEDLASIASSSGRTRSDLLQALARGFTVDDRA
jgi:hypothetical protein